MAFPDGWQRRAALAIQSSQVGETLTNFPLLLTRDTLPSEMFDADGSYPAQNGGGDIRFSSDSAGTTQLPCEVVSFVTDNDPANGSAEIWVKVPSVSSSADTTIYVWYNTAGTDSQPAVTDTYGRNAVWSDYDIVAHLKESANNTAGGYINAVGSNHGTGENMAEANRAAPFGGDVASFDDTGGHLIRFPIFVDANDDTVTLQGWGKVDDFDTDQRLVSVWDYDSGVSDDSSLVIWMDTDGGGDGWMAQSKDAGGTIVNIGLVTDNDATTNWQKLDFTFGPTSTDLYLDGASKATGASSGNWNDGDTATPTHLEVGHIYSGTGAGGYFDGGIAEIRLRIGALSAGWFAAEYANQSSPATFVVEGAPESTGSGPTAPVITTGTITNVTTEGFQVQFTTDTANGTAYYVVYPTSATDPTAVQIVAETDGDDGAALASGNQAVSTTGVQTFSPAVTGLSPNTTYRVSVVHYGTPA